MERRQVDVRVEHPRCPFCHENVVPSDDKVACTACMGWQHAACFSEGGNRCAACGVGEPVNVADGSSEEVPDTFLDAVVAYGLIIAWMALGAACGMGLGAVVVHVVGPVGVGVGLVATGYLGFAGGKLGAKIASGWKRAAE